MTVSTPARALGLTAIEARSRLERGGPNELPRVRRPRVITRIGAQLIAPLQILLLIAGVLSLVVTGDHPEGAAILANRRPQLDRRSSAGTTRRCGGGRPAESDRADGSGRA